MESQKEQFQGLEWVQKLFSLEPRWTIEPDVNAIQEATQQVRPNQDIKIAFLAQGAFNKLYTVEAGGESLIMRVSLPVDPRNKTLSEIATLAWIKRNIMLPVPEVIAYQPDRDKSVVGFEWILMKKVPGKPLADAWKSMTFAAKEQLVTQFAEYSSLVFRNQLTSIGSLHPETGSKVGKIVSMLFFWGDHIHQDVDRGPFRSSRDWIAASLSLLEHDCDLTLAKYQSKEEQDSDDEADKEDAERTKGIISQLKAQLDSIFPSSAANPEASMLFHDDLSQHNILVDGNGRLTGVVDWECVSALPLWKACSYPAFLEGKPRNREPDPDRYKINDPNALYWEHLQQYELTVLRRFFLDEMRRLEPRWVEVFECSRVQRDFEYAMRYSDFEFAARDIRAWLGEIAVVEDRAAVRGLEQRRDDFGSE